MVQRARADDNVPYNVRLRFVASSRPCGRRAAWSMRQRAAWSRRLPGGGMRVSGATDAGAGPQEAFDAACDTLPPSPAGQVGLCQCGEPLPNFHALSSGGSGKCDDCQKTAQKNQSRTPPNSFCRLQYSLLE